MCEPLEHMGLRLQQEGSAKHPEPCRTCQPLSGKIKRGESLIAKVGKGTRDLYPPAKVKRPRNVSLLLESRVKNRHWTSEGLRSAVTLGMAQWWNIARHAHCPGFHPQHYTDTLEYTHMHTHTGMQVLPTVDIFIHHQPSCRPRMTLRNLGMAYKAASRPIQYSVGPDSQESTIVLATGVQ